MKKYLFIFLFFIPCLAFADTITLTEPYDYSIWQRNLPVDHYGSLAVTGTYSGTPTTIEAQVINSSTSAVVKDWTEIDATPSGDAFSGTLTGIAEGYWYYVNVRYSNDHAVVDNGANHFGIGMLIGNIGQSNAVNLSRLTGGALAADSRTRKWDYNDVWYAGQDPEIIGWKTVTGAGFITLTKLLAQEYDIPVGILNYGSAGTSILLWTYDGDLYGRFRDSGLAYTGGKLEYVIWWQGEANYAMATATYQAAEEVLVDLVRTDTGQADLPFIVPLLGPNTCPYNYSLPNTAKTNNAAALTYYSTIMTSDLIPGTASNCPHYNYQSYELVARRIYNLITGSYPLVTLGEGAAISTSGTGISWR